MAKTTGKPLATSKPSKLAKKTEAPKAAEKKKSAAKKEEVKEEKVVKTASKSAAKPKKETPEEKGEISIEKKLIALYTLQQIDSQVDKIRIIRGELPLEVQDLEDEIAGLETRIENYLQETVALEKSIAEKKNVIKDCHTLIKKNQGVPGFHGSQKGGDRSIPEGTA
jgi:chromosome segregation ATPase